MFWMLFVYLLITFFVNHVAVQKRDEWLNKRSAHAYSTGIMFMTVIAVMLRLPMKAAGIVVYNLCCIGTIVAAAGDFLPVNTTTRWLLALLDNLGYASEAMRSLLVRECPFLARYSNSDWSFVYYDFHRGNGKIFSWVPDGGFREHEYARQVRVRLNK